MAKQVSLHGYHRVVVSGMGTCGAIAADVPRFASALESGRNCFSALAPNGAPDLAGVPIAELDEETLATGPEASVAALVPRVAERAAKAMRRAPRPVRAAVKVAVEAWAMARLGEAGGTRTGLVVAGQNVNRRYQHECTLAFWPEQASYLPPSYAVRFMDTDLVGTLSEILGIRGEGFTCGGASASGNVAIAQGFRMVQAGRADVCVVVGALADLSPVELQAFFSVGALAGRTFRGEPERACRPFDRAHEGFVYGQASACLVLESEASAERRGVLPIAEVLGAGVVLDARSSPDPSVEGEIRAMATALEEAAASPEEIDYLNTHGTSSPLGDQMEVQAIRSLFGAAGRVRVNSTKGLTGHCLWSAGVVEAVATLLQMQYGFVHPNRNLENPIDDGLRFVGPCAERADIRLALSNSFGFGGFNTSIVLRRVGRATGADDGALAANLGGRRVA